MKLLKHNDRYSPIPIEEHFDPEQLRIGTEVEMEHTDDPKVAARIAKDHLREDQNYYSKLAKMERGSPMWGWDGIFKF